MFSSRISKLNKSVKIATRDNRNFSNQLGDLLERFFLIVLIKYPNRNWVPLLISKTQYQSKSIKAEATEKVLRRLIAVSHRKGFFFIHKIVIEINLSCFGDVRDVFLKHSCVRHACKTSSPWNKKKAPRKWNKSRENEQTLLQYYWTEIYFVSLSKKNANVWRMQWVMSRWDSTWVEIQRLGDETLRLSFVNTQNHLIIFFPFNFTRKVGAIAGRRRDKRKLCHLRLVLTINLFHSSDSSSWRTFLVSFLKQKFIPQN